MRPPHPGGRAVHGTGGRRRPGAVL